MIDPKRWLDEGGGATFEERALLRAGRDHRMPAALRKRVWAGVATGLTAIETAAAAGTALQKGAAAKGAVSLLSGTAFKGVAALAIAGGVGFGVASLHSSSEPPSADVAHVAPSLMAKPPLGAKLTAELPAAAEPTAHREGDHAPPSEIAGRPENARSRPLHALRPASRPIIAPPSARGPEGQPTAPPQESGRASRLAEESAATIAIRKMLLSGKPAQALHMLDRAHLDFPDGALGQEREALAVRALVESGQKDAARRRGEAFLRAFPRSPHAAELRALLGP